MAVEIHMMFHFQRLATAIVLNLVGKLVMPVLKKYHSSFWRRRENYLFHNYLYYQDGQLE